MMDMLRVGTLALLLSACDPAPEGPMDTPPSGNRWRIGDFAGCSDKDVLYREAASDCDYTHMKPGGYSEGPSCAVWLIGIGGPFAIPGIAWLEFGCG